MFQVPNLPYKIATLVDLRDDRGRVLLLERKKAPNHGLFSPIGGKLDMATGESPAMCARREVMEEAGLDLPIERFHLLGMISETAFEGRGHWLIFYYRVMGSVWVEPHDMREGRLDWHEVGSIDGLRVPETDRRIIWPLVRAHEGGGGGLGLGGGGGGGLPGFFAVHIDCTGDGGRGMTWRVEESTVPSWRGRRG